MNRSGFFFFRIDVPRYAFRCRRDILVSIPVNRHGCLSAALDLNPTRKEKRGGEKKMIFSWRYDR